MPQYILFGYMDTWILGGLFGLGRACGVWGVVGCFGGLAVGLGLRMQDAVGCGIQVGLVLRE